MSFARVRALVIVGVLVLAAAIVVGAALYNDRQEKSDVVTGCPKGAVVADLQLPEEADVKIKLYNASAGAVSTDAFGNSLRSRGFQISKADPSAEPTPPTSEVAVVRYGPKAVGKAWVVLAYFLDDAKREFQINRTDDVVEVVVGSGFKKLATVSEVKQALWQLGRPTAPPGTCGKEN